MKVIAIDPGFERVGIAIIEKVTSSATRRGGGEKLLYSECFKTSPKIPHNERLLLIGKKINDIIKKFQPKAMAIEKLFFNTNQKTALSVSEARGVIMYEASLTSMPVFEYTPLQVKIAITGYGRSEKKQIMTMIPKLLKIDKDIKSDDEFDAIAIGLTCFASNFRN